MKLNEIARSVEKVAREAGKLICDAQAPDVFVKEGHANFVTSMDLASQKYIIEQLKKVLPEANFYAEESETNELDPGFNWIIDPIDGTTNYMLGFNHSCISIALIRDGKGLLGVVYDPYQDEMFTGIDGEGAYLNGKRFFAPARPLENAVVVFGSSPYYRELADLTFATVREVFEKFGDVRRTGSAALDLCYVACGKCDAYFEVQIQPWDYAAGAVIAREAGSTVRALQGGRLDYQKGVGVLAGSLRICDEIEKILNEQVKKLKNRKESKDDQTYRYMEV